MYHVNYLISDDLDSCIYYNNKFKDNLFDNFFSGVVEDILLARVDFMATAFDIPSLEFLVDIEIDAIKLASGDIVNLPLLKLASETGIPVIASTGAATTEQVQQACEVLKNGQSEFAILQCTSGYPADYSELNIRVIGSFRDLFPGTVIGFSSHENGVSMPLLAYALGARIIEKHFTINRTMKGTDQAFSLSPSGMKRLCRDLERAHVALGDGVKRVYDSEIQPMKKQRKSIVAARELPEGHIIGAGDIAYKVPNEGLLPMESHLIIGKAINRAIHTDDYILLSDVG